MCKYLERNVKIDMSTLCIDKSLPEYDDMRPDAVYELNNLVKAHGNLCILQKMLCKYIQCSDKVHQEYRSMKDTGIHIDILVNTLGHNNQLINCNYELYLNNQSFSNKFAIQYLTQVCNNIDSMNVYTTKYVAYEALCSLTTPQCFVPSASNLTMTLTLPEPLEPLTSKLNVMNVD